MFKLLVEHDERVSRDYIGDCLGLNGAHPAVAQR